MMGESIQGNGDGLIEPLRLSTGELRVEWRRTPEGASEQIAVRRGDSWIELARSDVDRPGIQSLVFSAAIAGSPREIPVVADRWEAHADRVLVHAHADAVPIQVIWRVAHGHLRVEVRVRFDEHTELESVRSRYLFAPDGQAYAAIQPLDLIHTPNLRPEDDDVIGDHRFHAPAIILQK
jgi:hypothetical protein